MEKNSDYYETIKREIEKLSKIDNTIFIGQQVASENFYNFLSNISLEKRTEFCVAEELQMGYSLGLALEGFYPISIYQRMDFLLRAADQLVNHLDLVNELSRGFFNPKVLIITTVGSTKPLDVGLQHNKDLTVGLDTILRNIKVYNPQTVEDVETSFKFSEETKYSSILVFYQDLFREN